jgi:hypothetical protein
VLIPPNAIVPSLQFSGHETFPLRQLWLRKAYDVLTTSSGKTKGVFVDQDAIVRFGVGKNMVTAIKHWSLATEFMQDDLQAVFVRLRSLMPYFRSQASTLFVSIRAQRGLFIGSSRGLGAALPLGGGYSTASFNKRLIKMGLFKPLNVTVQIDPIKSVTAL